ncbi:imelysin family protein, partial [Pseudomonas viridiflava]|uniref:imelysin family protein n=1 Tax=Pseudomonas viridiflava TaxID=33069 RepID=UPI002406FFD6
FQAEGWRSNTSLKSIAASLASAENLWKGVDNHGIRGLLPDEQKALAEKIDAAYVESRRQLDAMDRPLTELLADEAGRKALNDFYDCLNVVHR